MAGIGPTRCSLLTQFIACAAIASWAASLCAQNPFAQPADPDPAADDTAAAPAEVTAPQVDLSQYGPAVQTVLEQERTTPAEQLEGVLLFVDLGQDALAGPLLDTLVAADLDDNIKAKLARQFGTPALMQLARSDVLGRKASQLALSLTDALHQQVRDPKRLAELIQQLDSGDAQQRYQAIAGLLEAGDAAAAACVAAFAQTPTPRQLQGLRITLAELVPASVGPTVAGLYAPQAEIRRECATVLGSISRKHLLEHLYGLAYADDDPQVRQVATNAAVQLVGQLPSRDQVATALGKRIDQLLGTASPTQGPLRQIPVWYWNEQANQPVQSLVGVRASRVCQAAHLSRGLHRLNPYKSANEGLALALSLQCELPMGIPISPENLGGGEVATHNVSEALAFALDRDLPRGAAKAAAMLSQLRDPAALQFNAPSESPLVQALAHRDRGVRWAATRALLQFDLDTPFAGISRLPKALLEFVRSGSRPAALVAMSSLYDAQSLAATLDQQGYDVSATTTGRELLQQSFASGQVDLILVDVGITKPTLREVLFQLRSDARTGGSVIAVLGTGDGLTKARNIADRRWRTLAFAHPQNDDAMENIVQRAQSLVPVETPAEHQLPSAESMSLAALVGIGRLLDHPNIGYDVKVLEQAVLDATANQHLRQAAVRMLSKFGSHTSQLQLVDTVSTRPLPISLRQQAAEAFRDNVMRHGVLLTGEEIVRQYRRYNASETADAATQQVLGHVLDSIELLSTQAANR